MLLAIDVGNTNITCGVFSGVKLAATFRLTTKIPRTSDEYGLLLGGLLQSSGLREEEIDDVVLCSVVPNVMHALRGALAKYFHLSPLVVEAGVRTGIRIATPNPQQIGADRIVDAVAAYEIYGGPVLVIDFGTATTYDLVDETGAFLGGITSPGIRTAASALSSGAAKLPEIEIQKPDHVLGKDTTGSMQSGLFFGQLGQTEYLIEKVRQETGLSSMKVVATGGLGRLISAETEKIDDYDPNLTLKGMMLIHQRQKRQE